MGYKSESEMSDVCITPWIVNFCENYVGHEWYVEVPKNWIDDKFNLGHLHQQCVDFEDSLEYIMDEDNIENYEFDGDGGKEAASDYCKVLYGLIHSLYILSPGGIKQMIKKWKNSVYGTCRNHYCSDDNLLPVGLSCKPDVEMVRLLCPRCSCLYKPDKDHAHMDGAFWGREFAHFLFLTHPELRPDGASMSDKYVPRLWGFKLHPTYLDYQGKNSKKVDTVVSLCSQPVNSDDEAMDTQVARAEVQEEFPEKEMLDKQENEVAKENEKMDANIMDDICDTDAAVPVKDDPEEEEHIRKKIIAVTKWLTMNDKVDDVMSPWQNDGVVSDGGSSYPTYG